MGTVEDPIVLVVDDDASLRQLVRDEAESLGRKRVYTASDVRMAMQFLTQKWPREFMFVFLDFELQSQSENGLELLRRIQEEASDRVVARLWTGNLTKEMETEALAAGAYDVWDKSDYPLERVLSYTKWDSQHLRRLMASTTNPLTGLPNLRSFEESGIRALRGAMVEALDPRLPRRHPDVYTLLCMDLDRFRDVNERCGHPGGTEAIKAVARVIQKRARDLDLLCHPHGDEFFVLLPGETEVTAETVKEDLKEGVGEIEVLDLKGKREKISITIGGKQIWREDITNPQEDFEALLKAADEALYRAKPPGSPSGMHRVVVPGADA